MKSPSKKVKIRPPCSVEECERPSKCRGYCMKHYARWARHGDPEVIKVGGWKKNEFDFKSKEVPYHNYQDICTLADIFPFLYDDQFMKKFKTD